MHVNLIYFTHQVYCPSIVTTLTFDACDTGGPPRPGMLPTPPMGGPPMMPMMGPPPHGMMPGGPGKTHVSLTKLHSCLMCAEQHLLLLKVLNALTWLIVQNCCHKSTPKLCVPILLGGMRPPMGGPMQMMPGPPHMMRHPRPMMMPVRPGMMRPDR